ncbi:MAG: hypothetical protein AAB792_01410 [Patescibacteria group bacterium]
MQKPLVAGAAAIFLLLGIYFGIVSLVSGWSFAQGQFGQYWYFIVTLAIGFGVQVGLYVYLKGLFHRNDSSRKIVAVTGTTSTAAMISCCAHYLTNILPIVAATGVAAFVGQYQVKFFWVGLAFNFGGIAYIARKVITFRRNIK